MRRLAAPDVRSERNMEGDGPGVSLCMQRRSLLGHVSAGFDQLCGPSTRALRHDRDPTAPRLTLSSRVCQRSLRGLFPRPSQVQRHAAAGL